MLLKIHLFPWLSVESTSRINFFRSTVSWIPTWGKQELRNGKSFHSMKNGNPTMNREYDQGPNRVMITRQQDSTGSCVFVGLFQDLLRGWHPRLGWLIADCCFPIPPPPRGTSSSQPPATNQYQVINQSPESRPLKEATLEKVLKSYLKNYCWWFRNPAR